MKDVTARRRWRRTGAENGRAKLTETQVLEIRGLRAGGETLVSIGSKFGISFSTVNNICLRKLWKHI